LGAVTAMILAAAIMLHRRDDLLALLDEGDEFRCLVEPFTARSDRREVPMVKLFPFECAVLDMKQSQTKGIVRTHLNAARDR
jgi:hypothetical protein